MFTPSRFSLHSNANYRASPTLYYEVEFVTVIPFWLVRVQTVLIVSWVCIEEVTRRSIPFTENLESKYILVVGPLAVNNECGSATWHSNVFSSNSVLSATTARSKVTVVSLMRWVGPNVLVVESLDADVFSIVAVWLWTYLI